MADYFRITFEEEVYNLTMNIAKIICLSNRSIKKFQELYKQTFDIALRSRQEARAQIKEYDEYINIPDLAPVA